MTAAAPPTSDWIFTRYMMGLPELDGSAPKILCRRCGQEVDWVTRHAVERHGDTDIVVAPPVRPEPKGGWKW